ncbi:MAG: hypothetical protein GY944_28525 [bacterium]|nr:hypothetical protein [bacterium]
MREGLVELLLPRICAECHALIRRTAPSQRAVDGVLCTSCVRALRPLDPSACPRCQQGFVATRGKATCEGCAGEPSPLGSATAAVVFEAGAEKWIRAFKYPEPGLAGLVPGPEAIARALVRDAVAMTCAPAPDAVIPIPLHTQRLRERGFNPAAILARAVAHEVAARFDPETLLRVRDTPSQTRLDRRARRTNVRGAFTCARPPAQSLWLVDDVVTTGSTLEEAARTLRDGGARCVHAICAARTA